MNTNQPSPIGNASARAARPGIRSACAVALVASFLLSSGCQQPSPGGGGYESAFPGGTAPAGESSSGILAAGDTIRVTFAAETNLNTVAKIQLDGSVPLPLVGDVPAAGQTVLALQTNLTSRYQRFLKGDEVTVSLAASSASIYVTGAVLRPGKVLMDRPLTALEAVMEVGGFTPEAKSSAVTVIRVENGRQVTYTVDLYKTMTGASANPFWLKPYDMVRVPERKFNF